MKRFIEEFKAFALRGNMMDMAVGVIIGGAFSDIVTSLTDNFINPVLNLATGAAAYSLQDVAGFASNFISSMVHFLIMAFVLFCLLKAFPRWNHDLPMICRKYWCRYPCQPFFRRCRMLQPARL